MQGDLTKRSVDSIRVLAMDAVQKSGDGHPGTAMALAPLGYLLWTKYRKHNPADPLWADRDRFVLSVGHAAILQYSLLYLTGYDLTLDDLKSLRQWGSKTPGHPEVHHTPGVEATTGPLGTGFGQAVGMAMAEEYLARRFNKPGHTVFDHRTWVFGSDGDLMEGISHEAASMAGRLKLGKLIYFYDDNHITIEGPTEITYTDDAAKRFEAYGWHVQKLPDVNDLDALARAIEAAEADPRPSFLQIRSHIAYPAPKLTDQPKAHGSALGAEEVAATKQVLGWPQEPAFFVPDDVLADMRMTRDRGKKQQQEWESRLEQYRGAYPEDAAELDRCLANRLPDGWERDLPEFPAGKAMATRESAGKVLLDLYDRIPNLVGGSADLAGSTNTFSDKYPAFGQEGEGVVPRNVHFGIREFGAGAAVLGMALHGGVVPFCATFLTFSDFMRPAIRLACISEEPARYVFTHDSLGLGGDGPTHQPVEQLPALRAIPGITIIRPADANEARHAWIAALRCKGPALLVLTRQKVPTLDRSQLAPASGLEKGAYVLADAAGGPPQVILIASGSEVHVALAAREQLQGRGVRTRVVSMPSWELFERACAEDPDHREAILPAAVRARVAVEAASPFGWERYVGDAGEVVGVDRYGASAPGEFVLEQYGFTADNVAKHAERSLQKAQGPALVGGRA